MEAVAEKPGMDVESTGTFAGKTEQIAVRRPVVLSVEIMQSPADDRLFKTSDRRFRLSQIPFIGKLLGGGYTAPDK